MTFNYTAADGITATTVSDIGAIVNTESLPTSPSALITAGPSTTSPSAQITAGPSAQITAGAACKGEVADLPRNTCSLCGTAVTSTSLILHESNCQRQKRAREARERLNLTKAKDGKANRISEVHSHIMPGKSIYAIYNPNASNPCHYHPSHPPHHHPLTILTTTFLTN